MEKYAFAFEKKLDGIYRRKLGSHYIRLDARRTSYVSDKEHDLIKKLLGSEVKIVWGISFSNALDRADTIEYTK